MCDITKQPQTADLTEEQQALLELMESSLDPNLLEAVEQAYKQESEDEDASSVVISYEGTVYA